VAVFGGSLGARRINDAVLQLAEQWSTRSDRVIYHVVGRRDAAQFAGRGPTTGRRYVQVAFEDHMERLYLAADVVVSRAGAMTVAELAVAGVPAVLVPLPGAPGDHQGANARALEGAGGAMVLDDDHCTGPRLDSILDELIDTPWRLDAMADAARSMGRRHAAQSIASVAEAHARARPGMARTVAVSIDGGPSGPSPGSDVAPGRHQAVVS
jgi:UDP-N-acetylglucosamine--N-acetylmuramyl-(pentapeptide) pyrophosphoryl-undecaprenol N-acetylglucosamine transferase